jgi:hypothetical protein
LALHDAVVSAQLPSAATQQSHTSSSSSSSWQAELYRANNPGNVGLERFAAEHWVASHPHVQACDLSESNRIADYWKAATATPSTDGGTAGSTEKTRRQQTMTTMQDEHSSRNWSIALAPRKSIHAPWFRLNHTALLDILQEPNNNNNTNNNCSKRLHEWFLLPGFLYRWKRIYGLYPEPDSWVWDWFPNGPDWKQSILFSSTRQQQQPSNDAFPLWWLTPE